MNNRDKFYSTQNIVNLGIGCLLIVCIFWLPLLIGFVFLMGG